MDLFKFLGQYCKKLKFPNIKSNYAVSNFVNSGCPSKPVNKNLLSSHTFLFLKWTVPSLNLNMTIVAFRDVS